MAIRRGKSKKIQTKKDSLTFIKQIIKHCIKLKKLRPREVCIFNLYSKYGSYQVYIGPQCEEKECEVMHVKPHSRKLEINGSMHHLFVNPRNISPTPNQEDLRTNLKGSVIMKDVVIHIIDQDGSGASIQIENFHQSTVQAAEKINLAGKDGEQLMQKLNQSGKLAKETYRIIQEDILEALKEHAAKLI